MSRTAVLLINVGTPSSPEPGDVERYLREFLMDPLVVDLAFPLRWLFVNLLLPRRKHASSALYRKIWRPEGSPLRIFSEGLATRVQEELGADFVVRVAMRYGEPSLASVLSELRGEKISRLVAFPQYPQYSLAATETSLRALRGLAQRHLPGVPVHELGPFYDEPAYLDAVAQMSRPHLEGFDHVLFSFHGLPERQVQRTDGTGQHCIKRPDCCTSVREANALCYRAQCFATARSLALRLGLAHGTWDTAFQSRLGRTPWIAPYSDVLYAELPRRGVKRLAVLTPSFVADCLETLEEVQMRGRETFLAAGGEELKLVPSLNDHPAWAVVVAKWSREALYQPRT